MTVLIEKGLFIIWNFTITQIACEEKENSLSERHRAVLSTLLGFVVVMKAMNLFPQPYF